MQDDKWMNELVKLSEEMGLYDDRPNPMIKPENIKADEDPEMSDEEVEQWKRMLLNPENQITLTLEQWDDFVEILENPGEPSQRLREAMQRHKKNTQK